MRSARSDQHHGIRRLPIGPRSRQSPELSPFVVKEHAVLAPCLPAFEELECAAVQRVERMRHENGLGRTTRQRCI